MKLLVRFSLLLMAVAPIGTTAFVLAPRRPTNVLVSCSAVARPLAATAAAVALEPEPAGGIELSASAASLAGCRVKQLDEPATVQKDGAFQFWMTASAEAKLIQEIRSTILKDASKKANFPGFRKVRDSSS
jgi:hypothetical protein